MWFMPLLTFVKNAEMIEAKIYKTCRCRGLNDTVARLIIAQGMLESGKFTSGLFKNHNNIFGMKMPRKRPAKFIAGPAVKNIPPKNEGTTPYAAYNTVEDSVNDLIDYLHYVRFAFTASTPREYVTFLWKKNYFGGLYRHYLTGVDTFFNQIKNKNYENP